MELLKIVGLSVGVAAVSSVIVLAAMQALRAFQRKESSGLKTEPDLRSRRGVRSPQD
jgi:hypothetical protein